MPATRYVIEVTTRMPDGDAEEAVRRAASALTAGLPEACVTAKLVQATDLAEQDDREPGPFEGQRRRRGPWWYMLVRDASGLPFFRPEPGLDDKYGGSISLGTVMARAQAHARDFHTPEDFIRWQAPAPPGPRLSRFSPSMCCAAPLTVHGRDRHATCDSCGAAHPRAEPA